MLVLSRKLNEKIVINGNIIITVVKIDRNQVRLGIEAPGEIPVYREEILPLDIKEARDAQELLRKQSLATNLHDRNRPSEPGSSSVPEDLPSQPPATKAAPYPAVARSRNLRIRACSLSIEG